VIEFRLDYTKTQDRIKNLFQKKIRNKQIKPLHKFYHFFLFIYLFISFLLLLISKKTKKKHYQSLLLFLIIVVSV